jgi:hypothetical protein
VRLNHFFKTLDALEARFGRAVVEDGDFPARVAEDLDHRLGGQLAPLVVVGRDMRDDLGIGREAFNVASKDRNIRGIGLLNGRADRLRIARTEHDGGDPLGDEILDLILLLGDVEIAGDDDYVIAMLGGLGGEIVADDLEKRVREREHRKADRTFRLRRVAARLWTVGPIAAS